MAGEVTRAQRADIAETTPTGASAIISLIERAATDPNVDIDKMGRLLAMQERIMSRNAETAFNEALAAMQPELPEIDQKGRNTNTSKTYAKWEDIHEGITPVLAKYGFALSFKTEHSEKTVSVTAILRHRDGHSDQTSLPLPVDAGAGRNAVQSVGSSVSYGKRYTACALLNIRSRGEDDDGRKGGGRSNYITETQVLEVESLLGHIKATDAERKRFLSWLKVEAVEEIHTKDYHGAVKFLKNKRDEMQGASDKKGAK